MIVLDTCQHSQRLLTTAADEAGQSVIEFIFMLPLMVGMAVILLRVNTVIQIGIVNQKYARAQALWMAFNSAYYPRAEDVIKDFIPNKYNKMVIGVGGEQIPEEGLGVPPASTYKIARTKRTEKIGSTADQEEPKERIEVRVRNTVTLCTQLNFFRIGTTETPANPANPEYRVPPEGVGMDFCRGPSEQ